MHTDITARFFAFAGEGANCRAERQLPLHRLSRICAFARKRLNVNEWLPYKFLYFRLRSTLMGQMGPNVVQRIFLASRNGLKDRLINIGSWAIVSAMLHLPRQHWPSS
jgi:hypothetical protein